MSKADGHNLRASLARLETAVHRKVAAILAKRVEPRPVAADAEVRYGQAGRGLVASTIPNPAARSDQAIIPHRAGERDSSTMSEKQSCLTTFNMGAMKNKSESEASGSGKPLTFATTERYSKAGLFQRGLSKLGRAIKSVWHRMFR